MQKTRVSYGATIATAIQTLWTGLWLTLQHLFKARHTQPILPIQDPAYFEDREGIATIQYPHEILPVPDTGRYRLHNEIDDCIVCDKCAKVCPVDCITIEPIKAVGEFGKTSDGTSKRIYAATFDIDMGKCCFCGLCTTVCPTECLTMTKVYDFSVFDIRDHHYAYADMSDELIAQKKKEYDDFARAKEEKKASDVVQKEQAEQKPAVSKPGKPVFKPRIKPKDS